MSNHLAIATVTAGLGQRAHAAAEAAIGKTVTLQHDRPSTPPGAGLRRLHVYLYQVTPNAALRNEDLPTRGAGGHLAQRPRAALDLHYLLTFQGDHASLEPERMLGAVVRDLHARPVLTRQDIADAIAGSADLAASDLARAPEPVRFQLVPLSLEEQSKLWSVLFQTAHALSVACLVTTVLIEAQETPRPAPPVLRRGPDDQGVIVQLGPWPVLQSVHVGLPDEVGRHPEPPGWPAARLGLQLTLRGAGLGGAAVSLRLEHPLLPPVDLAVARADRTADTVRVLLPDDPPAQEAWAPGMYTVTARVADGGATRASNRLPLPLAPRLTVPAGPVARDATGDARLTVQVSPRLPVTATRAGAVWQLALRQPVLLLLAGREVAPEPLADSTAAAAPRSTDRLEFVLKQAPAVSGEIARLRVDGVDSLPFVRRDVPAPPRLILDDGQRVTIA